jgi:hypothetical protein
MMLNILLSRAIPSGLITPYSTDPSPAGKEKEGSKTQINRAYNLITLMGIPSILVVQDDKV